MTVDAPAKAFELLGAQGHARRDQSFALRLAPVFNYGRGCRHRDLSLMFSRELRNLATALLLALPLAGRAGPGDEAVLGAYDAYRAGDAIKLERFAKKLEGHALDPWIDYWSLAMRLEDAPAAEVQAFLAAHANTYVAELLRGDWLKVLGKHADWQEFERQLALYPRDDLEVRCYATLMDASRGQQTALADTMWMWLEPHELPDGCSELAQYLLDDERVSVSDV